MLKFSFSFLLLVLLFSCSNPVPKPVLGKRDTVIVVFKPKKGIHGPVQLYVGAYEVIQKIKMDTTSLKGTYEIGYKWSVKVSDTTPDGKGHQVLDTLHRSIPLWSPVPDSLTHYLTIDTTGN
jgi:hypothetical protein